jgi:hypothetical protein
MPEIDNDLFELLSLIGLGLIVLVGVALLGAIGRVRKSLDRTTAELERDSAWRGSEAQAASGAGSGAGLSAAEAEMPDAAAGEEHEEPVRAAAVSAGPGVVAAEAADQREPEPVAEEQPPVRQIEPEPQPAATPGSAAVEQPAPAARQPEEAPEPEPEPVATAEEPEGQPFERDGRWWFRRGDELLVYDEMSGQWQPAPQPETATPATQEVPVVEGEPDLGAQAPIEAAQPGAFWKCPSCGAVNGSTATSCRMCFTARP